MLNLTKTIYTLVSLFPFILMRQSLGMCMCRCLHHHMPTTTNKWLLKTWILTVRTAENCIIIEYFYWSSGSTFSLHPLQLWRRKLGSVLLQHPSWNTAQAWHVTVSESPVWSTTHSVTSETSVSMRVCVQAFLTTPAWLKRRRGGWGGMEGWRKRDEGGRWALRCDVISWKLFCVMMLHPTEALDPTAPYWPRKGQYEYSINIILTGKVWCLAVFFPHTHGNNLNILIALIVFSLH